MAHKHTHKHGHAHGARDPGDPNRWWANEAERLVHLLETGATLASGERAAAERELETRRRRAKTPVVVRREDVVFEPSSYKGIDIGYIIAPHLGMEVRHIQLEVHRIAGGVHSEAYRAGEAVCHVLNGAGYSIIDDERIDWGPHDSIHVQKGAWFQHFNTGDTTAHIMVAKPTPLLEHLAAHAMVPLGDDFTDPPDDYMPEHPFTRERVQVGYVDGEKWMSQLQQATNQRLWEKEERRRNARVILKADEATIERSEHKGDWKVGLVDQFLGFDNRILGMYVHQMPPDSHTETHKHGEAIVYVLSGHGYSIVEGERLEWKAGDCIFVQPGQWHQHFNSDPEEISQHLAFMTAPLRDDIVRGAEHVERRPEPDYEPDTTRADTAQWWG